MKKLINCTLIFLVCLIVYSLDAQDLHIYFDAKTEALSYQYKGDSVKQAKVRKNSNIYLHVKEFNNYLYDLEYELEDKDFSMSQGGFLSGDSGETSLPGGEGQGNLFFQILSGNSGAFLNQFSGLSGTTLGFGDSPEDMGKAAQAKQLLQELEATVEDMDRLEKKIALYQEEIQNVYNRQKIQQIAINDFEKIKHNPLLSSSQIKKLGSAYISYIFGTEDWNELTPDKLLSVTDPKKEILLHYNALVKANVEYTTNLQNLTAQKSNIQYLNWDNPEFVKLQSKVMKAEQSSLSYAEDLEKELNKMTLSLEELPSQHLDEIANFRMEAVSLLSNDFEKTIRLPANKDITNIRLKFVPKDSSQIAPVEFQPIQISSLGGLKIDASLGLSFTQFFNRPQQYSVQDSVIVSEDLDLFYPVITSFIHFLSRVTPNVSLGGSFGVGVPIVDSGQGQSPSFFLGGSVLLGRSESIILSGGLMGGKVPRLANGFEVDDVFDAGDGVIPLSYPYEWGGFVGVSFNLTK